LLVCAAVLACWIPARGATCVRTSGTTCPLVSSGEYAAKHDPFVYFDDVTNTLDPNSANCIAHIRPFTEMANGLATGNVAQYTLLLPIFATTCTIGASRSTMPSSRATRVCRKISPQSLTPGRFFHNRVEEVDFRTQRWSSLAVAGWSGV
jgi:hypothetical protein